jgi:hypothetical protein
MGTNYYHRTNICSCCGRYDEHHICKSMATFDTIKEWMEEPPYGQRILVGTWAEWKSQLRAGGEIWDEYGHQHDVETFIAEVETTPIEARRRHVDWFLNGHAPTYMHWRVTDEPTVDAEWLDADGFSFSGQGFS